MCRQIAEGVEAAHEKGVIHRDLKPANVKVTPEGKVKILDFGLAKAFEDEVSFSDIFQSPTLTEEMTRAGVILGTAAYMSPEQARGKAVDKRADVFAFGCVLYELLTSQRAFGGETVTDTLAKILEGEPDWDVLPQNTPAAIHTLLQRSLRKDPDRRFRDIEYAKIQIEEALNEPATVSPIKMASAVQSVRRRWALAVGLVVLGAVVAGLAVWLLVQPSSPEQSLNRFVFKPSPPAVLTSTISDDVAISPDGRQLVYMGIGEGGRQLYLRSLDDFVDRPIPGTANPQSMVFFSPDSKSIGFFAEGKLKKISLAGGSPITLFDALPISGSGDWFEDTIVFTATLPSGQGLYRVSVNGVEPEILATVNSDEGELGYATPKFLPDGKHILFTIGLSTGFQTALLSLETGERKVVLENARQARYLSTGHLIYEQSRTGNLMVVPFDLVALEVTGDSVQVVQGVRQTPLAFVDYAISRNGTLVYVPAGGRRAENSLVWVNRDGTEHPVTKEKRAYTSPRISPDGKRIALAFFEDDGRRNIWIYDIERESFSRLTFEGVDNAPLVWTPDGNWITFQSDRDGPNNLYHKAADGSGPAERLTTSDLTHVPTSWTPDGRLLAYHSLAGELGVWLLPMDGERKPELLISSPHFNCCAQFSPDGQWLAYVSDETGRNHVYVRPYPETSGKWLVSGEEGGGEPLWSPDGTELFYRSGPQMERMMAVSVHTEATFSAETPRVLLEGSYQLSATFPGNLPYYDISPHGQRFLMIKIEQQVGAQINVVLNWFEELKRLVSVN